jgi:spore coat protein CotF
MQDKDMVNDVLSQINSSLTGYSQVIAQSSNPQFRQTIQQIRNNCETFQYELYKMAEQKGYYKPAQMASMNEVQQVRSLFQ